MSTATLRPVRPMPEEMHDFQQVALICNISPEPVLPINHSTFGIFHIASPKLGERYALTQVDWAPMYMDKGDSIFNILRGPQHKAADPNLDNRIKSIQGARQIAEDLCQQMNTSDGPAGDSENSPFWGKFVCESANGPTEKELLYYEAKMKRYFLRVVEVGDREWGKAGRHDMIDSRCKIAARYLNITDRPWLMEYQPNVECPVCKEPIRAGAKVCRFCQSVLDPTGLEVPAKQHRGRKKKEEEPTL